MTRVTRALLASQRQQGTPLPGIIELHTDRRMETAMPRMFRIMKKDDDDKPTVGQTAMTLGVRPGEVDTDAQGNAIPNNKGMSVNPTWRVAPLFMIPKRL